MKSFVAPPKVWDVLKVSKVVRYGDNWQNTDSFHYILYSAIHKPIQTAATTSVKAHPFSLPTASTRLAQFLFDKSLFNSDTVVMTQKSHTTAIVLNRAKQACFWKT